MNMWIVFAIVVVLSLITLAAFAVPVFKQLKKTTDRAAEVSNNLQPK